MSSYITGLSKDLVEEGRAVMLYDNMNLSRLTVHAQRVEERWIRKKNRDAKKARSLDGGSSNGRPGIQDKTRFKKGFSNQVPSTFLKDRKYKVSNL